MAWLPMYLIREDVAQLNHLLNQEAELAFVVKNGFRKWIATNSHDIYNDLVDRPSVKYELWHVPSGPLPLIDPREPVRMFEVKTPQPIPDPWQGWTALVEEANPALPYFGLHGFGLPGTTSDTPYFGNATSTGVISLEIGLPRQDSIPISSFGWIGNHYREIGYPAHPTTEVFWQRFRKLIKKHTKHMPRGNDPAYKNEVYAFPEAYRAIQNGHLCRTF